MAEVTIALRAARFGADHAVADVAMFVDRILINRRGEAGPARAAVELGVRREQRRAATRAEIFAGRLVLVVQVRDWTFRPDA